MRLLFKVLLNRSRIREEMLSHINSLDLVLEIGRYTFIITHSVHFLLSNFQDNYTFFITCSADLGSIFRQSTVIHSNTTFLKVVIRVLNNVFI